MKNLHNKHIPTSWGLAIVGFLLVSVVLLIPLLQKTQIFQSNAMREPDRGVACNYSRAGILNPEGCFCSDKTGCRVGLECRNDKCVKNTVAPTSAPTKCYVRGKQGVCQWTSQNCSGNKKYYTGYCPGPSNFKCCAPK